MYACVHAWNVKSNTVVLWAQISCKSVIPGRYWVFRLAFKGGEMEANQYLRQVRGVCEYSGNDWLKVYLLRALHRRSGIERILSLMNSPASRWIFPAEVLRLQVRKYLKRQSSFHPSIQPSIHQRLGYSISKSNIEIFFSLQRMIPTSVDSFLCCGASYRAMRDAVARVLLENTSDTFVTELKVSKMPGGGWGSYVDFFFGAVCTVQKRKEL